MARTKYCKTIAQFAAALSVGQDCRLKLDAFGAVHVRHTFKSGILKGRAWSASVANARITRSRGTRDDGGGV